MISIPNPDAYKWQQKLNDKYPPKNLSTPEPPPKANGNPSIHDLVIEDIKDRKEFGLKKYGTLLQAGNGRKSVVDLHQELIDAVVYSRCVIEDQNVIIKALLLMVRQYLTLADSDGLLFHWHMTAGEAAIDLLIDLGYVQLARIEGECYEFTDKAIELMED